MSIRLRTKKLLTAGLWGALAMFLISAVIGYLWFQHNQKEQLAMREKHEKQIAEYEQWAKANNEVYSINRDVAAGDLIDSSMLQKVAVPNMAKAENIVFVSEIDGNVYAKVDMTKNTILTESVIYEDEMLENDVRKTEYGLIVLPTKLAAEDYVDVRIQFPNGDDYILLSKKTVQDVKNEVVWMNLDEGELLTMSSAIVDAYLEQAKIYAVQYVDGKVQEASQVTYPVKANVLELIQESPNIVNIAKLNLEKQNRARLETYLQQMNPEDKKTVRMGEISQRPAKSEEEEAAQTGTTEEQVTEEDIFNSTEGSESEQ